MKAKITKRFVDSLDGKEQAGDINIWDTELSGFGLRIRAKGTKTYFVKSRVNGKQVWVSIGRHGALYTPTTARKEAQDLLAQMNKGINPNAEKQKERKAITVEKLCELYLKEGCTTKKASTIATDRGRISRHIVPLLGKKRVKDVKRVDIERFIQDVAAGKTAANIKTKKRGRAIVKGGEGTATRTTGLLSGIFTFAVNRGVIDRNPVHGVKRFKDNKRERFLSQGELKRLGQAMKKAKAEGENVTGINAIRLLMLTGCRRSEVLTLKWKYVDFEWGCLRLPDSKTGAKVVPIGRPALDLLAKMSKFEGNEYVFASNVGNGHLINIQKVWDKVRELAGLEDVRLHDLRHSFASVGAASGDSLLMIGALLGHKDVKTTSRYAHLSAVPIKEAADRIAGVVDGAMRGY